MATVAEVLVQALHEVGVRTVFGLPGGETVEVLDALRRQKIDFVLVRNESSALFMADALARVTGTPGVCLTTLGPGATNAVVGTAHAYLDRAPVLVITAQKPDLLLPDYTHQVVDLARIFSPITKGSFKVGPDNVRKVVTHAIDILNTGRPGPVHLQLSNEDARQQATDSNVEPLSSPARRAIARSAAGGHGPEPQKIAVARQLIEGAKRPVIMAGLGLEPERPYAALRDLAETLQAPVIAAPKAKGCLPEDHPLSGGAIGLTRTDPAYEIMEESDCIIAVGFDVVELVKPWDSHAPLVWIAPWPNRDPVVPAQVEFDGPMTPVLQLLADGQYTPQKDWGTARIQSWREKHRAQELPVAAKGRILPQTVLQTMRRFSTAETPLAVDVGSHKIFGSLEWPALAPNTFFLSNGLSSMGYALPAAIGIALGLPGNSVLCLTGDAGMAMVMGELGALAERRLPVVVVVLNDGAIDLIRSHQVRSGKPVFGTEFASPDFSQIGAAHGIPSDRVTSQEDLELTIARALQTDGPVLVEVMLDPVSYPTTPARVNSEST